MEVIARPPGVCTERLSYEEPGLEYGGWYCDLPAGHDGDHGAQEPASDRPYSGFTDLRGTPVTVVLRWPRAGS